MRISDWSSDVCSSDLGTRGPFAIAPSQAGEGSVGLMRRFPLIATLIVALAVAAMIGLGVWQLQRMTWKDGLLNSYASAQGLPSIDWPVSPRSAERRVGTEGVGKCRSRWSPYH